MGASNHDHRHPMHPSFPTTPWSFHENKLFEQALAQTLITSSPVSPSPPPPLQSSVPSSPSYASSSYALGLAGGMDRIASLVPGKSAAQVQRHYDLLLHDLASIESGQILPPIYNDHQHDGHIPGTSDDAMGMLAPLSNGNNNSSVNDDVDDGDGDGDDGLSYDDNDEDDELNYSSCLVPHSSLPVNGSKKTHRHVVKPAGVGRPPGILSGGCTRVGIASSLSKVSEQERKKGVPWTEDEHRLFLLGLDKFGKGDWRSISRNLVVSRTPTQVASHAQKYFIRLHAINKDKRRSSIHDITSATGTTTASTPTTATPAAAAAAATTTTIGTGGAMDSSPINGMTGICLTTSATASTGPMLVRAATAPGYSASTHSSTPPSSPPHLRVPCPTPLQQPPSNPAFQHTPPFPSPVHHNHSPSLPPLYPHHYNHPSLSNPNSHPTHIRSPSSSSSTFLKHHHNHRLL